MYCKTYLFISPTPIIIGFVLYLYNNIVHCTVIIFITFRRRFYFIVYYNYERPTFLRVDASDCCCYCGKLRRGRTAILSTTDVTGQQVSFFPPAWEMTKAAARRQKRLSGVSIARITSVFCNRLPRSPGGMKASACESHGPTHPSVFFTANRATLRIDGLLQSPFPRGSLFICERRGLHTCAFLLTPTASSSHSPNLRRCE